MKTQIKPTPGRWCQHLFQLQLLLLLILFKYLRITVAKVTLIRTSLYINICDVNKQHSIISFMALCKKRQINFNNSIHSHFNSFYLSFKVHFICYRKRANEIIPSELAPRRNFCLKIIKLLWNTFICSVCLYHKTLSIINDTKYTN